MPLVIRLQAAQDLDRVLDRRLVDVDLLEAPRPGRGPSRSSCGIPCMWSSRCSGYCPRPKRRLEQVRRIHRATGGRAGADDGVDLVDEQDRADHRLELGEHGFEALLEIAAIARAGQERAHVERIDRGVLQYLGHFTLHDAARQTLGYGRLADARIARHRADCSSAGGTGSGWCGRPRSRGRSADRSCRCLRLLVEIDAIGVERVMAALFIGLAFGRAPRPRRLERDASRMRPGALAMPCEM